MENANQIIFGLMVDNKTNQPYAFAPIFDNGLSLFNFAMADDFADLETYAKSRLSAFDVPFDEIAKEFVTSRQGGAITPFTGVQIHSPQPLQSSRRKTQSIGAICSEAGGNFA